VQNRRSINRGERKTIPIARSTNPDDSVDLTRLSLWFAKTLPGTKNRAVLGRVGLNTIIARYGMKTLKGTNPSARGAHIYIKDRRKVGLD
jgi:hypothetical protein